MSTSISQLVYSQGHGNTSTIQLIPIILTRDPTSSDVKDESGMFAPGKRWINKSTNKTFTLTSFSATSGGITATWVEEGAGTGSLDELLGNTGAAFPSGGAITIAGTAPISTAASGSTVTVSTTAVSSIPTSAGTATASSNAISILGSNGVLTSGSGSTVTVGLPTTLSSWTPVLNFSGGVTGLTYGVQLGFYIPLGALTFFICQILLTSKGSSTGTAAISGLPVSGGIHGNSNAGTIGNWSVMTLDAGYTQIGWQVNGTTLLLNEMGSTKTYQQLADTNFGNTSLLIFSGLYTTD